MAASRMIILNIGFWPTGRASPYPTTCRASRRQTRTHLSRRLDDPVAVAHQRRHAGEAAAAVGEFWPGRPAHHAGHREPVAQRHEDRRAGIAGAGPEPRLLALVLRVDQ